MKRWQMLGQSRMKERKKKKWEKNTFHREFKTNRNYFKWTVMNMITERTSEKRNGFSCHCISKQRLKNILYKDENKQN